MTREVYYTVPNNFEVDPLNADNELKEVLDKLSRSTLDLIEASGIEDAAHFDYSPNGVYVEKSNARLPTIRGGLEQNLRIYRNNEEGSGTGWSIETNLASLPQGGVSGYNHLKVGVLSIYDHASYALFDDGAMVISELSRSLEFKHAIVLPDQAKKLYRNVFTPAKTIRAIAKNLDRLKARGKSTDWSRSEWALN